MTTAAATAELIDDSPTGSDRGLGVFLAVAGAIGTAASTLLTMDKIAILEAKVNGTEAALACDVSPFVSCTGVIQSAQGSAFGFPNPFLGMIAFATLTTLGVVLATGYRMPRWMWGGLLLGTVFGIGFVTWLQYESIYQIGRLCPWCMVVWTVMIPTFVVVVRRVTDWTFLRHWSGLVIALWYVAVAAAIWFRFGASLWA